MKKLALTSCIIVCLLLIPTVCLASLERGDDGHLVEVLQDRLIELGYLDGESDGIYGGQTASAVKAFQEQNGLETTGIADDETLKILYERTAVYAPGHTPAPTLVPTIAPEIQNGYVVSADELIKVPSVFSITASTEYNNYYNPTISFINTKSGESVEFTKQLYISDLLDTATDEDMASGAACCAVKIDKLTEGVYYLYYDISFGQARGTFTQVFLASKHFPDDFENGDIKVIDDGIPLIKKLLKNPNSLILRSVIATNYTSTNAIFYGYEVSAQNGFGGYSDGYFELVYNVDEDTFYYYDTWYSWMDKSDINDDTERQYDYE